MRSNVTSNGYGKPSGRLKMHCGLESRYCAKCEAEGIHKGGRCIHCGTPCVTHLPIDLIKNKRVKPIDDTLFGKAKALRDRAARGGKKVNPRQRSIANDITVQMAKA